MIGRRAKGYEMKVSIHQKFKNSQWRWFVCLVAKSCPTLVTPWTVAHQAPLSMGFSRQEYWSVGCSALLQGIFLTQESNLGFLHCRQILYRLSMREAPTIIILLKNSPPKTMIATFTNYPHWFQPSAGEIRFFFRKHPSRPGLLLVME